MAHYSSQLIRYEDGDKRPLKSISMRPLVFALDAQSRVDAEDERSGLCITAYTNMTAQRSSTPRFSTKSIQEKQRLKNNVTPTNVTTRSL